MPTKLKYDIKYLFNGVRAGNRTIIAKAITLIESKLKVDKAYSDKLINQLVPYCGKSIRIGITGSPGVGKSTFIDTFGEYLCKNGHKVAVLAIDPTSTLSGGSILGDKTRMEKLSNNKNAFIRPTPSGDSIGGIAHKTREAIIICEAAGFDVVLVETIGVGQNEFAVRSIVDLFLLLIEPGGGDELQGIKRGIIEISDIIIINKADGNSLKTAKATGQAYSNAIQFILPTTPGWKTKVHLVSSINNNGINELWEIINEFRTLTKENGEFQKRRQRQLIDWMNANIYEGLKNKINSSKSVINSKTKLEKMVLSGHISPVKAAEKILDVFYKSLKK